MNKFIVWDNDEERFIDESKCMWRVLYFHRNEKDFVNEVSDDLDMFQSIGKQDVYGKEIYPDCSIVEFIEEDTNVFAIGYLCFDKKRLRYRVYDLDEKKYYKYSEFMSYDIRVIDTIQENKLGLIK